MNPTLELTKQTYITTMKLYIEKSNKNNGQYCPFSITITKSQDTNHSHTISISSNRDTQTCKDHITVTIIDYSKIIFKPKNNFFYDY